MLRTWSFICPLLFFAILLPPLAAQEGEGPELPPLESEWEDYAPSLYSMGDKTFIITLGVIIPTVFAGDIDEEGHGVKVGGTGFLAYNYFLGSHFHIGGELGGMFAGTRGESMLFIIPFGLRFGYQFVVSRFEFPLTLVVGGAAQKYLDQNYLGFFLKPGAAAYWRFNSDWSFGLNVNWWIVPQWPKDGKNATGNFLETTLSARYHF